MGSPLPEQGTADVLGHIVKSASLTQNSRHPTSLCLSFLVFQRPIGALVTSYPLTDATTGL